MAVRTQPGELARHAVPLRPQHTSCAEAAPRLGGSVLECRLEAIDYAGDAGRAETVVNVYDADI